MFRKSTKAKAKPLETKVGEFAYFEAISQGMDEAKKTSKAE